MLVHSHRGSRRLGNEGEEGGKKGDREGRQQRGVTHQLQRRRGERPAPWQRAQRNELRRKEERKGKREKEKGREGGRFGGRELYLEKDERDIALGAEFDEVGSLEGRLREEDAVVGYDAWEGGWMGGWEGGREGGREEGKMGQMGHCQYKQ